MSIILLKPKILLQADEVPRSDQNHSEASGDANHKKMEYKHVDSLAP